MNDKEHISQLLRERIATLEETKKRLKVEIELALLKNGNKNISGKVPHRKRHLKLLPFRQKGKKGGAR